MMHEEQTRAGERLETLSVDDAGTEELDTQPVEEAEQTPPAPPAEARGNTDSGFMQPFGVSDELAVIVGTKPLSRTDITKKIWDYIKLHGLQDKQQRRNINCNDALEAVFGKPVVTMFEMTKLVQKHLRNPDGTKLSGKSADSGGAKKSSKKKPSKTGQVKTPAAATKGAAAKGTAGKQPSLINATQSKLLSARLDAVANAKMPKGDLLGRLRPLDQGDDDNPAGEFIAAAIRAGRLKIKSDLSVIFVNLIERFAGFGWGIDVIYFEVNGGDMEEIFENPGEIAKLKAEFEADQGQKKAQAKKFRDAVQKKKMQIERVLAAGTHTGEEITVMIDEFEQMTFAGGE